MLFKHSDIKAVYICDIGFLFQGTSNKKSPARDSLWPSFF